MSKLLPPYNLTPFEAPEGMKLSCYVYDARSFKSPKAIIDRLAPLGFDSVIFGCWMDGSSGVKELGGDSLLPYMKAVADAGMRVALWAYPNSERVDACLDRVESLVKAHSQQGPGYWISEIVANTERHMKGDAGAWGALREGWKRIADQYASWSTWCPYGMVQWHDGAGGLTLDGRESLYYRTVRPMFYSVPIATARRGVKFFVSDCGFQIVGPSIPAIRKGWPKGNRAPVDVYAYATQLESAIEDAGAACDRMAVWSLKNLTDSKTKAALKRLAEGTA